MTFNPAQYEATIRRLESGLNELSRLLQRLPAVTESAANRWYMTDGMSASLIATSNRLGSAGGDLTAQVKELLHGAVAPLRVYYIARDWRLVRGLAAGG